MKQKDLVILAFLIALAGWWMAPEPAPEVVPRKPARVTTPAILKELNPLSIHGIQLGMSVKEISQRLGTPRYSKGTAIYGDPWVAAVGFEKGVAVWIRGDKVYRNGSLLVCWGQSNEEVAKRLGKPLSTWSNNSWCGKCAETEKDYADGLTVTYGLGMMLDDKLFGNVHFDLVDPSYRKHFLKHRQRDRWAR